MVSLPRVLDGIGPIAADHDWFVVDQWGVLHDGHTAHPGAIDALRRLRQHGPVVLISNTSRRVATAEAVLARLGFDRDLYDACFTAGELAARWLAEHAASGPVRVHSLLGPPDAESLLHTVPVTLADSVADADVVLVAGTWRSARTDFDPALRRAAERGLPLLCANPDVRSIQPDGSFIWCPGAFAERYAAMGGAVVHFGKPKPALYEAARAVVGDRARGLAFGDSLAHDVRGARDAGIAIVLVTRGIHGPDLALGPHDRPRADRVAQLAHRYGTSVDFAISSFRW